MRTLAAPGRIGALFIAVLLSVGTSSVRAQSEPEPQPPDDSTKTKMEIYGFTMLDNIFDFERNDPLWFDVMRPTKLPAFEDEFGLNRHYYASVRQSRLGVKTNTDTKYGDLKTIFEFELFGVGEDAG
jgi:hypothetical protein